MACWPVNRNQKSQLFVLHQPYIISLSPIRKQSIKNAKVFDSKDHRWFRKTYIKRHYHQQHLSDSITKLRNWIVTSCDRFFLSNSLDRFKYRQQNQISRVRRFVIESRLSQCLSQNLSKIRILSESDWIVSPNVLSLNFPSKLKRGGKNRFFFFLIITRGCRNVVKLLHQLTLWSL